MPWHPGLSVGIELIDEQHKELFRRADMLFEAGRKGQAKEYIGELMAFLLIVNRIDPPYANKIDPPESNNCELVVM